MNRKDQFLIEKAYVQIYENKSVLISRRSKEERQQNYLISIIRQIQEYIKNGNRGDLDLSHTPITSLPNELKLINGNLILTDTKIKSLPRGLIVNGHLVLEGSLIKDLPEDLTVTKDLYLYDTPLGRKYDEENLFELEEMLPNVNRVITHYVDLVDIYQ